MKLTCKMTEDLLPLYLEDSCSPDSRAAVEAHLSSCPSCRQIIARMSSSEPDIQAADPGMSGYIRRIRLHRLRIALCTLAAAAVAAMLLALIFLTLHDMRVQANPTVFPVEAGTINLTEGELDVRAADADGYVLFTNSTKIAVTSSSDAAFSGEVILLDAASYTPMLYGHIDSDSPTCIFSNLSSANRYRVSCDAGADLTITISEGRTVGFFSSMKSVTAEIFSLLFA